MGEVAESGQEVLNQAFDLDVAVGNGISPADIKRLKDFGIATLEMVLMYTKKDLEKVKGNIFGYRYKHPELPSIENLTKIDSFRFFRNKS